MVFHERPYFTHHAVKASSYMTFEVAGKGGFEAVDPFDASDTNSSGKYYGFTCYVSSIQMADQITPTFHCDGYDDVTDYSYTVLDYVEFVEDNAASYAGAGQAGMTTLALVRSLADYGHYVQPFLSASHGWTIGTDYAAMPAAAEIEGSRAHVITAADVDAAAAATAKNAIEWTLPDGCGVEEATQSLKLSTGTDIVLYFKMQDGASVVSATIDGEATTPMQGSDGRWAVTVPNIKAQDLGLNYNVSVQTSTGATVKAKVSALSYASALFASDSYKDNDQARYAMAALYRYWDAAVKYLEATGGENA